jgi:hypothetical protein
VTRRRLLSLVAALLACAAALPAAALAAWGGRVTASDGESVNVRASDTYPQDPALLQKWADFLAGLVHGPELGTVTLYLAPLAEVQARCGRGAFACYSDRSGLIVAPADNPAPDVSAAAVITHEYGHHVAASRTNAPWAAIDYGAKRWASYENVCARTRAGTLFPGAENGRQYTLNPGEAFAETYRVLNERLEGLPETPWEVVSGALYPDTAALEALRQDVLAPWTSTTRVAYSGGISARARARTFTVATPYDGSLRATVRATRGPVTVTLLTRTGARAATTTVAAGTSRSLSTTVCGSRTYRLRVAYTRAAARFTIAVART